MRKAAVVVVQAILLVSVGASAHTSTRISVFDSYFSPTPAEAEAGHDVTWTWACDYGGCAGTHNVTAYQGATFASATMSYPASFTTTIPAEADVVKYRCTLHSALSGGVCNGMCGVLGSDVAAPQTTMSSPTDGQLFTGAGVPVPVQFSGMATDNVGVVAVSVRVYDLLGRATDHNATCDGGCGGTSVSWSAQASLLPGTYLADAAAFDGVGNHKRTVRVRFFVV